MIGIDVLAERWDASLTSELGPLRAAGVPREFWQARLSQRQRDALLERFTPAGLVISGLVGRGKSYLAAATVAEIGRVHLVEKPRPHFSGRWVLWPDLLLELRERMGKRESTMGPLKRLAAVSLLVLDDFGADRANAWAEELLLFLLARRIGEERPTIITTNLSLEDIGHWSERIGSRLQQFGLAVMRGPDRRVRA